MYQTPFSSLVITPFPAQHKQTACGHQQPLHWGHL